MTGADKAIDGDSSTKWFDSARAPLVVQLPSSAEVEAGAIWVFPIIVGFPPKSSIFNKVFHYKPSILRYHYFWKHLSSGVFIRFVEFAVRLLRYTSFTKVDNQSWSIVI